MTTIDLRLKYHADSGRYPALPEESLYRQLEIYNDRIEEYMTWLESELIKLYNTKEA
jgi:hypothetical protein